MSRTQMCSLPQRRCFYPDWTSWFSLCLSLAICVPTLADEPKDEPLQHRHTNALIHSDSPYLLQHAHNPVNWMPWGPAAFEKAKAENKPIFVSIGYSTCYWCHVMERESFENEEVAAVLNANYIAIKVDREQRPDIDEQLMLATQLLTGRGGWPNSVWLTTDGRPWMAGTYFPRAQFIDALQQLAGVWETQAEAVDKQADSLSEAIRKASRVASPVIVVAPGQTPIQRAIDELSQLFDAQHGGFGSKPKFPPHGGLRLLAFAARNQDAAAREMLTQTLDAMWMGGIHDHIGGGFHRYSTDERWFLPHFEKMLYDNAQLMRSYAEAFEITGDANYRTAAQDIFGWLQREMTHPDGGFYSALDSESALTAESEREEGRFTTWSVSEVREVLSEDEARLFEQAYHITESGNFTEEATGERPGTNIPFLSDSIAATATLRQNRDEQSAQQLANIRAKLLVARDQRPRPRLDDKVLTSWNGLMLSSLAYAGRVLQEPAFTAAAERGADFLLSELRATDGLLHSWRAGKASIPGYLDDYAFLLDALLELYKTTDDERWLRAAVSLGDEMLERFEDKASGGFFFTSGEHEQLLVRSKNLLGGGNLPVGNGVALLGLLEMHQATGDDRYLQATQRSLKAFSGIMLQSPRQVEHLVLADALYADRQAGRSAQSALLPADAQYQDQAITAGLYLSHAQRAAGEPLGVAVAIHIQPEYHLYGPPESGDPVVQATSVKLLTGPNVVAPAWQLPTGKTELDAVLDTMVTTYSGTIWFYLPARIAANVPHGKLDVRIELNYQACDQDRCLQPKTIELSAPLIISETTDAPGQHAAVFDQW
jgi:uncharacterized protein YyaL (SSP411 family)